MLFETWKHSFKKVCFEIILHKRTFNAFCYIKEKGGNQKPSFDDGKIIQKKKNKKKDNGRQNTAHKTKDSETLTPLNRGGGAWTQVLRTEISSCYTCDTNSVKEGAYNKCALFVLRHVFIETNTVHSGVNKVWRYRRVIQVGQTIWWSKNKQKCTKHYTVKEQTKVYKTLHSQRTNKSVQNTTQSMNKRKCTKSKFFFIISAF